MSTTLTQSPRPLGFANTAKFSVTADNDVLFAATGGTKLVVGAIFTGATALNINSGADETAYPLVVTGAQTLNVTTAGAGTVTLVYYELPVVTEGFQETGS